MVVVEVVRDVAWLDVVGDVETLVVVVVLVLVLLLVVLLLLLMRLLLLVLPFVAGVAAAPVPLVVVVVVILLNVFVSVNDRMVLWSVCVRVCVPLTDSFLLVALGMFNSY